MSTVVRFLANLVMVAAVSSATFVAVTAVTEASFTWLGLLGANAVGAVIYLLSGLVLGLVVVVTAMIRANRSGDRYGDTYPHP